MKRKLWVIFVVLMLAKLPITPGGVTSTASLFLDPLPDGAVISLEFQPPDPIAPPDPVLPPDPVTPPDPVLPGGRGSGDPAR